MSHPRVVLSDRGETKLKTEASHSNTRLPRAVVERMERINASLEAKKNAGNDGAPPPPANEPPPPADTETDTQIIEGKPAADPRENDPAYWRQRFNVTQGMLRTQQETHRAALDEKDRELTELRSRVRSLEAGSSSNTESDKADVALFFSPEEIERFGQDQCEAMAKAAVKAARQQAKTLFDAEVKPLQDKTKSDQARAQEDKENAFWEKLAEHVPDWDVVNKTPAWLEWCAADDEATGLQRQDIIDRHRGALNALGVAKMFKDFKAIGTKARPVPPVAPPRGASGAQVDGEMNNVPAKGYPSKDESRDYYKRAKLGKVSDKERAEFEARLRSKAVA